MKITRAMTIVLTGAVLVVGTAGTRSASGAGSCVDVRGLYVANVTTNGCTSPIGLCATGSVTIGMGANQVATTTLIALDLAPFAGMPAHEPAANASYSGTITFTTTKGDVLTVRDLGVIDSNGSTFTEIERPVGGTGIFANATGDFFISGTLSNNQNTFTGHLSGQLCGL
jgi:hypothetical protein